LILSSILAIWATHEATLNETNMELKAGAEGCHYDTEQKMWTPEYCTDDKRMWEDVWGRSVRGWIFAGMFSAMAIITIEPSIEEREEE
jgi:hypothetical protein